MSVQTRSQLVLEQAKDLSCRVDSWADFSNRVFDQRNGLVAKAFPEDFERQAFYDSPEYVAVNKILADLMRTHGVVDGANAREKSGRFVVRVPKSVHQRLDVESKREGVSLNQLAVSKLSIPLRDSVGLDDNALIDAFNAVHDGYSTDYVVIHPELNFDFLEACRDAGLSNTPRALNHRLMNIRKTKPLSDRLNKANKRTRFKGYDKFEFAAEIAVRMLQRTEGVTLDTILCDIDIRDRFDRIARGLVPEFSALEFRAAALNLRKGHRLKPIDKEVQEYDLTSVGPVKAIDLSRLEELPGLYALYDSNRPLFAGETSNLRDRIRRHLSGAIPDWAWDEDTLSLRMMVVPSGRIEYRRQWLMHFINSERPLLNYQKCA